MEDSVKATTNAFQGFAAVDFVKGNLKEIIAHSIQIVIQDFLASKRSSGLSQQSVNLWEKQEVHV
jgi:hypothetical protein